MKLGDIHYSIPKLSAKHSGRGTVALAQGVSIKDASEPRHSLCPRAFDEGDNSVEGTDTALGRRDKRAQIRMSQLAQT